MGRHEESIAATKRACELDPLSPIMTHALASSYLAARRYDEALPLELSVIEQMPEYPPAYMVLSEIYGGLGDDEKAVENSLKLVALDGAPDEVIETIRARFGESGMEGVHRLLIEHPDNESGVSLAMAYAALGDKDEAFRWLDRAVERRDGDLVRIKLFRGLDPLRDDPRFDALLKRLNFPE